MGSNRQEVEEAEDNRQTAMDNATQIKDLVLKFRVKCEERGNDSAMIHGGLREALDGLEKYVGPFRTAI